MSPRPAFPRTPEPAAAARLADELADILAREHHILADAHPILPGEAAVSVYVGLLARTDGRLIWWQVPTFGERGKPLWTYATTPATAARRLAEHCKALQGRSLAEILRGREFLADVLVDRYATPA
ncbi:hypothetical protein [Planomonospora sp. ID82291]|uniref:hypothetical protein n=1 Tax=Planomonospora sp. ID82291 TaxID=2738136 RepID=UPI0018C4170D|nr:hypothetical protein [Planomonospora sp. ID82291]MBG0819063.1 hypothetical protein [Planomonospora sp. ID82291]